MNTGKRASFAKIEEVSIIKKKLCDHVVSARVHFRLEVVHFDQTIRGRRMAFGKTGDTNTEAAAIGMRSGIIESSNKPHQINRVLKRIARFIVEHVARPIAAQRKNVSYRCFGVS